MRDIGAWRGAALVVVAAALLAAGCGDGPDDQAPRLAPAKVESAWTERLLGWIDGVTLGGPDGACAELDASVGAPPSRALERIRGVAREMCADFEHARPGQQQALRSGGQDAYLAAQADRDAGEAELRLLGRRAVEHRAGTEQATLPRLAQLTTQSREEPTFAAIASKLGGVPDVVVRCWSPADWKRVSRAYARRYGVTFDLAGFTNADTRSIDLAPDVCSALARIRYGSGDTPINEAFGLNVLAHESMHLLEQDPSEAAAECYAMQHVARVGVLLGMPPEQAQRRAELYLHEVYPDQLDDYRSPDCRPGGGLDESPGGPWP
jgi:hypothetical protein